MPVLPRSRTLTRPSGQAAPAAFLAVSSVEARCASGWDRHRHAEHEAIVVSDGDYRGSLNGAPVVLRSGGIMVAKPGDWHEDLLQPGCAYRAIWFRLPGGLFAPGVAASQQMARAVKGAVGAADGIERLAVAGATPARLDAALAVLLGVLVDALPSAALAPAFAAEQGFEARLHAVFVRLPAGPIAAEALARALGMTRRTLERRCRDELGCGPVQAYARWRLQRAGELLRTTDWPVRAVSEALGFANPFHFSRAFARVHGAPPALWRERIG